MTHCGFGPGFDPAENDTVLDRLEGLPVAVGNTSATRTGYLYPCSQVFTYTGGDFNAASSSFTCIWLRDYADSIITEFSICTHHQLLSRPDIMPLRRTHFATVLILKFTCNFSSHVFARRTRHRWSWTSAIFQDDSLRNMIWPLYRSINSAAMASLKTRYGPEWVSRNKAGYVSSGNMTLSRMGQV